MNCHLAALAKIKFPERLVPEARLNQLTERGMVGAGRQVFDKLRGRLKTEADHRDPCSMRLSKHPGPISDRPAQAPGTIVSSPPDILQRGSI